MVQMLDGPMHCWSRSIKIWREPVPPRPNGGCANLKSKDKCIYIALIFVVHSRRSGMDHTVLPAITPIPAFTSYVGLLTIKDFFDD